MPMYVWNTVVMSGLLPPVATSSWSITYSPFGPLAHHRNVASLGLFYRYLVDVLQNWLNWFHFLFLEEGLLVILIDCMIFLPPFLDVTSMSMSTVSFLAQLDPRILCLRMLSLDL